MEDIDILMARLERMSQDLYKKSPERLSEEGHEADEATGPAAKAPAAKAPAKTAPEEPKQ